MIVGIATLWNAVETLVYVCWALIGMAITSVLKLFKR